ncbi:PREDICTED: ubiquitin-conjugating enzyme E2 T-like [Nicrophorus vespilloides]|uniref:Ubiquitin-conjugating enzyme E2 T-like n=1 Tax=Nicrophorus vespilloides TaxID=110193 RepID=A0ABM1MFR2_NICVS|nr:PREDICTED: ubiquitin-conjugating enzyme E2 T-like [Nicrophorus vespilloides]
MQRNTRMARELKRLEEAPPPGISVSAKENKLNLLEAQILGPPDSPYANSLFNLEILIPDNYPFTPPSIKFLTKVYHPNIDDNGRICLDLIKMPPKGGWKPTIGIENLLIATRMLLENPNPNDPLMADIAAEFINDPKEFEKKAKEHCKLYC